MDYGEILSRAWKIIWKHKVLWIFGILASCSGGGNNNRFNINQNNGGQSGNFPGSLPPGVEQWLRGVGDGQWVTIAVIAVVLICLLSLLSAFLVTMGKIGLIHGASQADQDETVHLTLGGLFSSSLRYFWRVFLLNLIVTVITLVVVLAFAVIGFVVFGGMAGLNANGNSNSLAAGMGLGVMLFVLCLCCIFIPISIVVSVILEMAYLAIITEDLSIGAGLSRGWEVLKANLGHVVLLWLILGLGIGFIGGLIISVPFLMVAAPAMLAMLGEGAARNAGIGISLICCAIYLPIMLVLRGILESYIRVAWALAYRRFIGLGANTSGPVAPLSGAPADVFDLPTPVA